MPGCVVTVDSFGEEIQLHFLGFFIEKYILKREKWKRKKM